MLKSLRVRLLFYQNFAVITIAISMFGGYLILESGIGLFVIPVFFMKVITNGLIGLIFHFFRQNRLYFFHNLGVTAFDLYVSAFFIDLLLWFGVTIIPLLLI
jgi:hypothetical protein